VAGPFCDIRVPTDIDIQFEYGKVTAIPTSRRFRGGLRFEF